MSELINKNIEDLINDNDELTDHQLKQEAESLHHYNALDEVAKLEEDLLDQNHDTDNSEDNSESVQRDYLSEILTSALIIASGGKDLDEAGITELHKHDLFEIIEDLLWSIDAEKSGRQMRISEIKAKLDEAFERDKSSTDSFV